MQHQSIHSLGTTNNCHEQTSSSSLFFWQSSSWQVVKQTAVFFLLGARDRRTAANNEFYLRVKASVGDPEATTRNEDLPGTADEIIRQAKEFKDDITRHNRRSIHHYCLIGRNFHTLKTGNSLTPDACRELGYSVLYVQFLINLYKLSNFYPKIKRVNIGIGELKTHFKALKESVAREKQFWRTR